MLTIFADMMLEATRMSPHECPADANRSLPGRGRPVPPAPDTHQETSATASYSPRGKRWRSSRMLRSMWLRM